MSKSLLLSSLLLLFLSSTLAITHYKINPATRRFIDQHNRTVLFHGVNTVYKLSPSYPPILDKFDPHLSLAQVDFENLRSWGLNMIRLYVAWEAVEPVRGQYNTSYLDILLNITKTAAKNNVTVLLDAHQDNINRKLCGEGFPDWAVNRTNFPHPVDNKISYDENGHANIADCVKVDFRKYWKSDDMRKSFKAFYEDKDGIAESFANFWKVVAEHFREQPNVLGYELLNEPYTIDDSIIKNYDKQYLQPLYKRVHNKIREVDNDTIIFFENIISDTISVGFTEGPGGPSYNDRQAFSYHIYCNYVDSHGEPINPSICQTQDTSEAKVKTAAAEKLGVGAFLSEFGAVGNGTKSIGEINTVTAIADTYLHSWSYWQFKYYNDFTTLDKPGTIESFYNEDGSLQTGKVKALSRSYVYATCGHAMSQVFDPATGRFVFVWKASNQCNGRKTELFVNEEFYYPNGLDVTFVRCDKCTLYPVFTGQKNYYVADVPKDMEEGSLITLNILPKDKKTVQEIAH